MNNISTQLSNIAGGAAIQVFGGIARIPLVYVLAIFLARRLGSSDYGLWVLGISIQNILLILVLAGIPKALNRFIPLYSSKHGYGETKTLITRLVKYSFLAGVSICILIWLLPLERYASLFPDARLVPITRIVSLSLPFMAIILLISSCFIGFKKAGLQVWTEWILLGFLQIASAVIIFDLVSDPSIFDWAWAYSASVMISSIFSLIVFKVNIWSEISNFPSIQIDMMKVVKYFWPLTINNGLSLFSGQIVFVLVGYLGTNEFVSALRIYLYLVMPLQLVVTSMARIYQPIVTENVGANQIEDILIYFRKVAKWTLQINVFGAIILILMGEFLVKTFFGEEYLLSALGLNVLVIGKLIDASVGPTKMTLEAFGRSGLILINSFIIVVSQVILSYILIPRYGFLGASLSITFSIIITNLVELIIVRHLYGVSPDPIDSIKIVIAGSIILIPLVVFNNGMDQQGVLNQIVIGGIGAAGYWVLSNAFGVIDDQDLSIIRGYIDRAKLTLTRIGIS